MRKLHRLSAAVTLALGLTVVQGAEIETPKFKTSGYKPAEQSVHMALSQRKNQVPLKMATVFVEPDRTKITQLANISQWPAKLVYNQGHFGTCTANSGAFTICFLSIINSKTPNVLDGNSEMLRPSRWFMYYNTRYLESKLGNHKFDATNDSGASIAGSILAIDMWGSCPEDARIKEQTIKTFDLVGSITYNGWPYKPKYLAVQPTPLNYLAALDKSIDGLNEGTPYTTPNKPTNLYERISQTFKYRDLASPYRKGYSRSENSQREKDSFINSVNDSLKKNRPVMAGVMLDDSFMDSKNGYITTPNLATFEATGGHAITIVGYGPYDKEDPTKTYFKFINSWDSNWGDGGFGYFPEAYFANVNVFSIEAYSTWFENRTK